MELLWRVELENGATVTGSTLMQPGENRIVCELPDDTLKSVTGAMLWDTEPGERIFINGFQSWTYSPECGVKDRTPSFASPLARFKPLGLERYGDYYFTDYPETPGVTHGESYAYWRRGDHFRLLGSLDESSGYTMIRYDANAGKLTLSRDCCGVRCNGEFHVFDLFYAEGAEKEVYDGWFARHGPAEKARRAHCRVFELVQPLSGHRREMHPLRSLRLRRGALRGRCIPDRRRLGAAVGDWLTTDAKKFPKGLRGTADKIHERLFARGSGSRRSSARRIRRSSGGTRTGCCA